MNSKIIVIICESKRNCTERQYFKYVQKIQRNTLKHDMLCFSMGSKFEVNRFMNRMSIIKELRMF